MTLHENERWGTTCTHGFDVEGMDKNDAYRTIMDARGHYAKMVTHHRLRVVQWQEGSNAKGNGRGFYGED